MWAPTEQLLKWKTAAVLYHLNRPVLTKNQSWELNLASGSICPPTLLYSSQAEYLIQTKGINNGSEHQRLLFYVSVLLFFVFCACNKIRNPSITLLEQKTGIMAFFFFFYQTDRVVFKCVANRETWKDSAKLWLLI